MTRVTRLPGDHSQVGWLPPSSVPYHYSEKDSSPLTRGKLDSENNLWEELRLISAHAGKTSATHGRHSDAQAHPRSRGENMRPYAARLNALGSSPLTRGKHTLDQAFKDAARLIPAHAGKTMPPTASLEAHRAHPRSRGENASTTAHPFA